ncbi:hypothetical protein BMS3Abin02_00568 [bacterium BMS3Abin02]|nr:hypothetical protein BMS3Abin02_00568 [bacterium BMS3Abin02]GBE22987.1 hypothetical protein BMS3Bbin01_02365 [bacterium BMS3Bbin01]HDH26661.1 DUF2587 domain-containing protein [Actinomycetota bacterium]HDL50340.1 DUF2587 domain-containing protein [Actinomycetota bacterium]
MDEHTIEQADENTNEQAIEPEIVESAVTQPTKVIRIASMTRAMLEEVRQAPLDEAGRIRLLAIYTRTLEELKEVLSDDLREELDDVFLPLTSQIPSESELRIAQAQLVGWLEGLFHGIQASLWTQQMAAQAQLQEVRSRKSLEAPDVSPGQYL